MNKKTIITEKHLDKALNQPWNTCTCLIAQAIQEAEKSTVYCCGRGSAGLLNGRNVYFQGRAIDLQKQFDSAFSMTSGNFNPNNPIPEIIESIRQQLPVEMEYQTNE